MNKSEIHTESSTIIPCAIPTGKTFKNPSIYREAALKMPNSHGMRYSPEYGIWRGMLKRCGNPKNQHWKHYGGRGIKVCQEWHDFRTFIRDVGKRPTKDHSLDRYPNNDGNYEPGNVRWATAVQQHRNTRTNRMITIDGITRCAREWDEVMNFPPDAIIQRLIKGWDERRAVLTPLRKINREITIEGVTRKLSEWAELMNVRMGLIRERIEDGWSERDAIMTPVKKSNATQPSTD